MEEDIMELRHQYLKKEVKIVDGSQEDGNFGLVVGVTANSAEPLTVLFSVYERMKHENYYRPQDVQLTGGVWQQDKPCDQTLRCRRSRFDGLFRMIDGRGPHGEGSGTKGGAWAQYLSEVVRHDEPGKEQSGAEAGIETVGTVAAETAQVDGLAGPEHGSELPDSLVLGRRDVAPEPDQCNEVEEADGTDLGTADTVTAKK